MEATINTNKQINMETITLTEIKMTFAEALQYLKDGKCLGIKPCDNTNYLVKYRSKWMNEGTKDVMIKWNSEKENPDQGIRIDQFLGIWNPVIINHETIE